MKPQNRHKRQVTRQPRATSRDTKTKSIWRQPTPDSCIPDDLVKQEKCRCGAHVFQKKRSVPKLEHAIESIESSRFIQSFSAIGSWISRGSLEDPYPSPTSDAGSPAWHTQCEAQELRHGSAKTRRQPGDVLLMCDSRSKRLGLIPVIRFIPLWILT